MKAEPSALPALEEGRRVLRELSARAAAPSSVYRLQLTPALTFRAAERLVPYLSELGIDWLYLSPSLKAAPGSLSGYDVADPTALSPELGGARDFDRLCSRARAAGMGVLLDIVPNHMGVGADGNPYWDDLLELGRGSRYARLFDVDWRPAKEELRDKVLIPTLEDHYGRVLDARLLSLGWADGRFHVRYRSRRFPVSPASWPGILEPGLGEAAAACSAGDRRALDSALREARAGESARAALELRTLARRCGRFRRHLESRLAAYNAGGPESAELLDRLLSEQAYRLAHWRVASDEINYRRFFDCNDLAAIRAERPEVFELTHRLPFQLLDEGRITGLRIDHPDGLYDPAGYFARLQERAMRRALEKAGVSGADADALLAEDEFRSAAPLYVVVEKILDRKETLPEDWRVHGTVGYEALNALNGVFVDRDNEGELSAVYEAFIGRRKDLARLIHDAKRAFLRNSMGGELELLGHRLDSISEMNRRYRDFTRRRLSWALREVIQCFPVYRTYVAPGDAAVSDRDRRYVEIAVAKAKKEARGLEPEVFDFVRDVLLLDVEKEIPEDQRPLYRDFVLRFQQLTAPAMAKGLEDTAFYIDSRLISLNEVGGDPAHFGCAPAELHRLNHERARRWPKALIATSTHDTKRSEDVRLRIDALSEIPADWRREAMLWAARNEKHKTMVGEALEPDRDVEYFIYQSLLGVWPDRDPEGRDREELVRRLQDYVRKSIRESKVKTDWINPDAEYEAAVERFLAAILAPGEDNGFLKDFEPFRRRVAELGRLNSLSALTLKLGSPGAADVYMGCELWRMSLVDPDNRRPVDFDARAAALSAIGRLEGAKGLEGAARELFAAREDGRIKLHCLSRGLRLRRRLPGLFLGGEYHPLKPSGPREQQLIAFMRRDGSRLLVAAAGRFFSRMPDPGPDAWADDHVLLPAECRGRVFEDAYTGAAVAPTERDGQPALAARTLFRVMPSALLVSE